jgi:hypothetical protein
MVHLIIMILVDIDGSLIIFDLATSNGSLAHYGFDL